MTLLRLALLLATYLSLDFSNPMMPGAVSFGDGVSVEGRQPDRVRGADVGETALALADLDETRSLEPAVTVRRSAAPDIRAVWQTYFTRLYPSLSRQASRSEDA